MQKTATRMDKVKKIPIHVYFCLLTLILLSVRTATWEFEMGCVRSAINNVIKFTIDIDTSVTKFWGPRKNGAPFELQTVSALSTATVLASGAIQCVCV